jgi:hypothetical protein
MLYSGIPNEWGWSTSNFGATYTEAGFGTSVAAHATNANAKGTAVSLLAGASVTEDVYGIEIVVVGGFTAVNVRRYLADLLIDPAGGSSWTTIINNLAFGGPAWIQSGYRYYFPLYLKSGTSIGMQQQCTTAAIAFRAGVKLFGKPTRPDKVDCGTKVETFGATTASSSGTGITPGNGVLGSYTASLGTTVADLWWWQWGGILSNDTTITPQKGVMGEVACGDATNKKLCYTGYTWAMTNEDQGKDSGFQCVRTIKAGEAVYVRCAGSGAADTTPTTTAYGLG